MNVPHEVKNARSLLEQGRVSKTLLSKLYSSYQFVPHIDSFIEKSTVLFPRLNCGIASLYLQYVLGEGEIVRGKYKTHHHTFLFINHKTVLDITADQYGGPAVYVGKLLFPWAL